MTVDNGGLALRLALAGRKISPKAGIIDSLKIPNSSIDAAGFLPIGYKTPNSISADTTNRETPALGVAPALTASTISNGNIRINITHGSTMSGASRWKCAGGSGQSGGAEGSGGCHRRAGGTAGGEAADDVVRWVKRVFTACLQAGKSRCAWQLTRSVSWQLWSVA